MALLERIVGPSSSLPANHEPFPSRSTTLVSLVLFLACLVVVVLAAHYPRSWITLTQGFMFSLAGVVLVCVISDCLRARVKRRRQQPQQYDYRRNLAYTVVLVMISIVTLPVLYIQLWYPALLQDVIQSRTDAVTQAYFPSITVFQKTDWTSQATIDVFEGGRRPKCGLHWLPAPNHSWPACSDIANPGTERCDCAANWDLAVNESFVWQNTRYRAITLHATEDMVCVTPTTKMVAQVFFSYNTAEASRDAGRLLQPSLYIAVFDPTLTVRQALENGYTRMQLVNANGMVAVTLGLNMRQASADTAPAYDYDVAVSSIPSQSTLEGGEAGWLSLFVEFPAFERKVNVVQKAMEWTDMVAVAGAWFSFFQIISWVMSGAALQM